MDLHVVNPFGDVKDSYNISNGNKTKGNVWVGVSS